MKEKLRPAVILFTVSNAKTYWKILWWINPFPKPFRTKIRCPKVAFAHSWIWRNICETTQLFPNVFCGLIFGKIHKITGWASFAASQNGTRNFIFGNICHFHKNVKISADFEIAEFWRAQLLNCDRQFWRKKWKGCVSGNWILPRKIWFKETTKGNSELRFQSTRMSAIVLPALQSYPLIVYLQETL